MAKITVEKFRNFFKYYKGEEHQIKAIDLQYEELECNCCEHLDSEDEWIKVYRKQDQVPEKTPAGK